ELGFMDCGGTTPLWLHLEKFRAHKGSVRCRTDCVGRKAGTCPRSPRITRPQASVLPSSIGSAVLKSRHADSPARKDRSAPAHPQLRRVLPRTGVSFRHSGGSAPVGPGCTRLRAELH